MDRDHELKVRLGAGELARLDELRPEDVSRAGYVRELLRDAAPVAARVLTREEALAVLSRLAEDGRVAAAIALARELRHDERPDADDPLEELLRRARR
jgi:hypothetical protein